MQIVSRHHLHKYEKHGKWAWQDARAQRPNQSNHLAGDKERRSIWPDPASPRKKMARLGRSGQSGQ